jgi:nucleotide-binding universal stress UspA family protein
MDEEAQALREAIGAGASTLVSPVRIEVTRDRPAVSLQQFSAEIDLLVIGSRRWGPTAHLLMGGTGEALVRGARCPLLIVPRPHRAPADPAV